MEVLRVELMYGIFWGSFSMLRHVLCWSEQFMTSFSSKYIVCTNVRCFLEIETLTTIWYANHWNAESINNINVFMIMLLCFSIELWGIKQQRRQSMCIISKHSKVHQRRLVSFNFFLSIKSSLNHDLIKSFVISLGHLPQSPQMTSIDLQNGQDSNGAGGNQSGVVQINGGSEQRITNGYSINGILGIQHSNDPNVNTMKRKRVEDHGKDYNHNLAQEILSPSLSLLKKPLHCNNPRFFFFYFFSFSDLQRVFLVFFIFPTNPRQALKFGKNSFSSEFFLFCVYVCGKPLLLFSFIIIMLWIKEPNPKMNK